MKLKALAVAAVLIGVFSFIAPASAFDTTPPVLVSATVSPTSLPESGGAVTVTLVVSSPTYGLANPPVIVFGLGNLGRQQGAGRMTLISGDAKSGTYGITANFVAPLMPGVYSLTVFPLGDAAQNRTDFLYPNVTVTVGGTVSTPTPAPVVTISPTSSPTTPTTAGAATQSDLAAQLKTLQDQVAQLTAANVALVNQVEILKNASSLSLAVKLHARLAKICSARPRPKGC
jgi:hypothetical protein